MEYVLLPKLKLMDSLQHRAPLWAQLFIAIFYLALITVASSMGGNASPEFDLTNPSLLLMLKIGQVILVTITFIVPVMLFSYVMRAEKLAFLPLKKMPNWRALIVALTICLFALPLVSGTAQWNANMHLPSFMSGIESWMRVKENIAGETIKVFFVNNTLGNMFINLFVIAFMAGLSEEIFFRGFLQRLFIENKMNKHIAVWLTAILFSAIHLQFFGFIPRVLLGAVLGYLYVFTNNLWVPIIAHTVNNGFAVVMAYLTGSMESDPLTKNGQETISPMLVLSSALLITIQLVFLYRIQRKKLSDLIDTIESK